MKLRQDVVRLSRELSERSDTQHAEEEHRKALESKMAATEEQLAQVKVRERPLTFQGLFFFCCCRHRCYLNPYETFVCVLQAGRTEAQQALQQTLEKVKAELCQSQSNSAALQAQLQQAQQEGSQLSGQ